MITGADNLAANEDTFHPNVRTNVEGDHCLTDVESMSLGHITSSRGGIAGPDRDANLNPIRGSVVMVTYGDHEVELVDTAEVDAEIHHSMVPVCALYSVRAYIPAVLSGTSSLESSCMASYVNGSHSMDGEMDGTLPGPSHEAGCIPVTNEDVIVRR